MGWKNDLKSKGVNEEIIVEAISRFIEVGTKLGYWMTIVSENMETIINKWEWN